MVAAPEVAIPTLAVSPQVPVSPQSPEGRAVPGKGEQRLLLRRNPKDAKIGITFEVQATSGAIVINGVDKFSSADGKVFVGDKLLAINGNRLVAFAPLEVALALFRDAPHEIEIIVSDECKMVYIDRESVGDKIGLTLEHSPYPRPVKILKVDADSYGAKYGLEAGEWIVSINGNRMASQQQCVKFILETPSKVLSVKVRPSVTKAKESVTGRMVRSLSFSKRTRKPSANTSRDNSSENSQATSNRTVLENSPKTSSRGPESARFEF